MIAARPNKREYDDCYDNGASHDVYVVCIIVACNVVVDDDVDVEDDDDDCDDDDDDDHDEEEDVDRDDNLPPLVAQEGEPIETSPIGHTCRHLAQTFAFLFIIQ